ncbi:MAG: hypothetical protein LR017_04135 [Candidatus Pacebacteria bacterium]|nr:hypothetical protein [Candidatus Paceibacterota bacterium]
MYSYIHTALDILFPPSAEARLVRSMSRESATTLMAIRRKSDTTILAPFSDIRVQALIHEAKFHGSAHAYTVLAAMLTEYLKTHPAKPKSIYIPIPLSKKRMRDRGYNQVAQILAHSRLPTNTTALVRTRNTQPQTKLSREDRRTNMHQAFSAPNPDTVRGRHVVLIDDVTTTGATLHAATSALRHAGAASITTIALTG